MIRRLLWTLLSLAIVIAAALLFVALGGYGFLMQVLDGVVQITGGQRG